MSGIDDRRWAVTPEFTEETEIVALGGRVGPSPLLAGYARGEFPMQLEVDQTRNVTAWYSPAVRAVLRHPGMAVSRSLRRSMRGFTITYDRAFEATLAGCADPRREHGWITEDDQRAYRGLFAAGYAHSVEVWAGDDLVGGLIGVQLGGLFCADSKFRRVTDASKAAVAGLSAAVFGDRWGPARLIDAQWLTEHLASLGFQQCPREQYLAGLPALLATPPALGRPGSPHGWADEAAGGRST